MGREEEIKLFKCFNWLFKRLWLCLFLFCFFTVALTDFSEEFRTSTTRKWARQHITSHRFSFWLQNIFCLSHHYEIVLLIKYVFSFVVIFKSFWLICIKCFESFAKLVAKLWSKIIVVFCNEFEFPSSVILFQPRYPDNVVNLNHALMNT